MPETDVNPGPAPGAFSALLKRVARFPSVSVDQAWAIPLRPGELVGRYEIRREIGRGGFGAVYEALDRELGRAVAVKTVRPGRSLAADGGAAWLHDEAEAIASLSHPGIVAVYDVGEADGTPYVVMERLRGETLEDRLARGLPRRDEALRIAREVATALSYAHGRGVVHRDLKPANVFLCEDGGTKLLDFGLSHVFGHGRGPRSGGTPAYLAPERWRGEPEDARTDVFSLGVLLYEMLSGKAPYPASEYHSAVLDPGSEPALEGPGIPRRLAALVAGALAKEPARRPANASAFLEQLVAVQRALEARRRRWVRTAGLAAGIGAAVAVALTFRSHAIAPPARERLAISVADFANETGEPDLDGLSGLVVTSLEQSRRLQVLTRARMIDVLRQLGREDAPRIDETLAREIGRRTKAWAVLIGSVRRFDRTYSLELRALDPAQDRYLFAVHDEGVGKASVPAVIDRISARAREQLRERTDEIRSSTMQVAQAVTPNLEAYEHYFVGLDCMERPSRYPSHPKGCLEEFHRAVAIDPGFALAWFQIASAGWDELTPAAEDRDAAIAEALRHADRVPPKDRMLITAWAAYLGGKEDEALTIYREVTSAFPDDKQALYVAGDLLFHRGDPAAAVPYLEAVLKLDPTFEFALDHLSYSLAVLGRRDELAEWVRTWSAMAPTPAVLGALVRGQLGLGDAPAAIATARRALEMSPSAYSLRALGWALSFSGDYETLEAELRAREAALTPILRYALAHALAAQGRRTEALRLLDAIQRRSPDDAVRRDVRLVRAQHLAGDGDADGIWAEAKALLSENPAPATGDWCGRRFGAAGSCGAGLLAPYLAWFGDLGHARELASHLEPGSSHYQLFVAALDWREGRPDLARANLAAVESRDPLPFPAMIAPAFLRAEVAADEGLDSEAVEALRRFQRLPFQPYWRSWAYPRSLFLLARSLERLGRRDEARAELDRLLRLWAHADPDLPLLKEARALRARLGAGE
jgi:eukaryotic-like serine/threonine-protein kinase